ncbi:hypothetical protein J6590_003578 [Homalodisca vitripennis]|nr:hypothetical protein J6590_003578 [Homalodisca vitripennis]
MESSSRMMLLAASLQVYVVHSSNSQKQIFATESSDFRKVVKSCFFVDKSMLIRDLFEENQAFQEITAGPHFAKSTNLDMIKRFFSITVNREGVPVRANITSNYKLFQDNKLLIYENDKTFFNIHFGNYPVLYIDYKPLDGVSSFDHMLRKYRHILSNTFSQHKYLLEVATIWNNEFNRTMFESYLEYSPLYDLHKEDVRNGFIFLSSLLFRHFNKCVFVLIDDYDIVSMSPVNAHDRSDVIEFVRSANNALVQHSRYVSRAVVTGSLWRGRTMRPSGVSVAPNSIGKYYGLSLSELKPLLLKFLNDETEVEDAADYIIATYSGYVHDEEWYLDQSAPSTRGSQVCSVWSVIQYYVCHRKLNITMF